MAAYFPPTGGACEVPAAIARALMEGVGVMWRRVEVKNWGVSGAWDHVEEGGSEELGRLKTTFAPPVIVCKRARPCCGDVNSAGGGGSVHHF